MAWLEMSRAQGKKLYIQRNSNKMKKNYKETKLVESIDRLFELRNEKKCVMWKRYGGSKLIPAAFVVNMSLQFVVNQLGNDRLFEVEEVVKSKTKIWLAVDEDGMECEYNAEPERGFGGRRWTCRGCCWELKKGSIEKLIGRPLTWEDEPVEI